MIRRAVPAKLPGWEGRKLDRAYLGPRQGCVIRLMQISMADLSLAKVSKLFCQRRHVSVGTARRFVLHGLRGDSGNLKAFRVLPCIETLIILVDNDEHGGGQKAALECSARWTKAGKTVVRLVPRDLGDFNNTIGFKVAA